LQWRLPMTRCPRVNHVRFSWKYAIRSRHELHRYITAAKSFLSTYCANMTDKRLLRYRPKTANKITATGASDKWILTAKVVFNTSLCWASSVGSQRDATRICCWAPAPLQRTCCRSISPARGALGSKPAGRICCCRSMGQTDGRTSDRYRDPVPHTMRAGSVWACARRAMSHWLVWQCIRCGRALRSCYQHHCHQVTHRQCHSSQDTNAIDTTSVLVVAALRSGLRLYARTLTRPLNTSPWKAKISVPGHRSTLGQRPIH